MEHYYHRIEGAFTFPTLYSSAVSYFDNAKFVEIGCDKGQSFCFLGVETIIQNKNIELYAIDMWDDICISQSSSDKIYNMFLDNIKPIQERLNDKIKVIKSNSVDASTKFEDKSLDFIFIDACHEYECVLADLNAWYPKLKPGGWIAGHDYYTGHYGVERAVNEFFYEKSENLNCQECCWIYRV